MSLSFHLLFLALTVSPGQTFWLPMVGQRRRAVTAVIHRQPTTALQSGYGIAANYTWKEEAFELDVTVKVPSNTRPRDIKFAAFVQSVDLQLQQEDGSAVALISKERKLRGRVNLDGTFWVISDPEESADYREVTVTIEKIIQTPKDDFEVVDYNWKGVFKHEDPEEVSKRKYDKPEVLDVREYAASMGVDIDNIDMSKVDKNMFNSGLNISQSTLDQLEKSGYLSPDVVTKQADGSEFTANQDGEAVPFSPLGTPDNVVPFIDTDSSWHAASNGGNQTVVQQTRNFTRAAFAQDSTKPASGINPFDRKSTMDPIDALTNKRLKEILRAQGLKVSGNKKELQERLRGQVNSLLQGKQNEKA